MAAAAQFALYTHLRVDNANSEGQRCSSTRNTPAATPGDAAPPLEPAPRTSAADPRSSEVTASCVVSPGVAYTGGRGPSLTRWKTASLPGGPTWEVEVATGGLHASQYAEHIDVVPRAFFTPEGSHQERIEDSQEVNQEDISQEEWVLVQSNGVIYVCNPTTLKTEQTLGAASRFTTFFSGAKQQANTPIISFSVRKLGSSMPSMRPEDVMDPKVVLAAAHKRLVSLYSVREAASGRRELVNTLLVALQESPKSMYWLDINTLVVGTKSCIYLISPLGTVREVYSHAQGRTILDMITGTQIGVLATPVVASTKVGSVSSRFFVTLENVTYLKKLKFNNDKSKNILNPNVQSTRVVNRATLLASHRDAGIGSSSMANRAHGAVATASKADLIPKDTSTIMDWGFSPSQVLHYPPFLVAVRPAQVKLSLEETTKGLFGLSSQPQAQSNSSASMSRQSSSKSVGSDDKTGNVNAIGLHHDSLVIAAISTRKVVGEIKLRGLLDVIPMTNESLKPFFSIDENEILKDDVLTHTISDDNNELDYLDTPILDTKPRYEAFDRQSFITTTNGVVRMVPCSVLDVIRGLCNSYFFQTAVALVVNMRFTKRAMRRMITNIGLMHASYVFNKQKDYASAISIYIKYHAHPREVIANFPEFESISYFESTLDVPTSLLRSSLSTGRHSQSKIENITFENLDEGTIRANNEAAINKGKDPKNSTQNSSSPTSQQARQTEYYKIKADGTMDNQESGPSGHTDTSTSLTKPTETPIQAILLLMKYLTGEKLSISEIRHENEQMLKSGNVSMIGVDYDGAESMETSLGNGSIVAASVAGSIATTVSGFNAMDNMLGKLFDGGNLGYAASHKKKLRNSERLNELAKLVDTSLLLVYLKVRPALIKPLLRQTNFCDVEKCEPILKQLKMVEELVLLYKGNGLHEKALDYLTIIWKKSLDTQKKKAVTFSDDTSTTTKHVKKPKDYSANDIKSVLIDYLKSLDFETQLDLVFKYSASFIEDEVNGANQTKKTESKSKKEKKDISSTRSCISIFTENYGRINDSTRFRIIEYLDGFDKILSIEYCTHLIVEERCVNVDINNKYLYLMIELLMNISRNQGVPTELKGGEDDISTSRRTSTSSLPPRMEPSLSVQEFLTATKLGPEINFTSRRETLFDFLYSNDNYDPNAITDYMQRKYAEENLKAKKSGESTENRVSRLSKRLYKDISAILLYKLSKYNDALEIYTEHDDFDGAGKFCEKVYDTDKPELKEIFGKLFEKYSDRLTYILKKLGETDDPSKKKSLKALSFSFSERLGTFMVTYASKLQPSKVLSKLPSEMTMDSCKLYEYLMVSIVHHRSIKSDLTMQESLLLQRKVGIELVNNQLEAAAAAAAEAANASATETSAHTMAEAICPICSRAINDQYYSLDQRGSMVHTYCLN